MQSFSDILRLTKIRLLQLHYEASCGHLGGNFSCIDALVTLYHRVMGPNDRFVLSKGHSAGALYATLWSLGLLSDADLQTFTRDNSLLPGHPSGSGIPGLMFSTGSLGHGPSLAAGLALAARHKGLNHEVFCLCSDGEWQEGSCWEALSFAIHHRLENLVLLIDQNGLQGFGRTSDVISCNDLSQRIAGFGTDVQKINGHDPDAIMKAIARPTTGAPRVLILDTVKGRGLHFEDTLESHYLPLSEVDYVAARSILEQEGTQ
ncbi:1-deoxy-D-xylulose-5-phosphate synthase N-terminal domain-containing protein [Pseudomonas protegens]|uniref:1-deoxy-D-xylulose-5-phosphate synthase N-terminal domain-containing protein n=1 Tax=Pseudomonas protegens TaxID=380021 RepID=UPI000F4B0915|nr:1-deoxy-D-xylulose-5-phosphate synthase N-terminal domain-containing protein [Pseudomonas protegens]